MKKKSEILKNDTAQAEKIIMAETGNREIYKTSTVSLEESIKKEFQKFMGKGTGLNMSLVFNTFMKMYISSPDLRKQISKEILTESVKNI